MLSSALSSPGVIGGRGGGGVVDLDLIKGEVLPSLTPASSSLPSSMSLFRFRLASLFSKLIGDDFLSSILSISSSDILTSPSPSLSSSFFVGHKSWFAADSVAGSSSLAFDLLLPVDCPSLAFFSAFFFS